MNMQILALAIYNATGKRREVHFRLGQVNIITGASKTGKSSFTAPLTANVPADVPAPSPT